MHEFRKGFCHRILKDIIAPIVIETRQYSSQAWPRQNHLHTMEKLQWDILWGHVCFLEEWVLSAQWVPGAWGSSTVINEYGGVWVTQMSWHAVLTPATPKFISQLGEAYSQLQFYLQRPLIWCEVWRHVCLTSYPINQPEKNKGRHSADVWHSQPFWLWKLSLWALKEGHSLQLSPPAVFTAGSLLILDQKWIIILHFKTLRVVNFFI